MSWSDIIRRQGEESRARSEAEITAAIEGLPDAKATLRQLTNDDLVAHAMAWASRYDHRPRMQAIVEDMKQACMVELLKRLNAS